MPIHKASHVVVPPGKGNVSKIISICACAARYSLLGNDFLSVTLSKKIDQYDSWTQPLQAAVQLILAFPDGEKPTVGSLISFIKTKPFKIQTQSIKLSDKLSRGGDCSVKPLQLAEKSDVDIPKVKELLKSTLLQLLDTIGISWEESIEGQKSLDSWFS